MPNPDFVATWSTNEVYRNADERRCLTDDLDAMDADIAALKAGKAPIDHTHTPADIGAAPNTHGHAQSDITGLETALGEKAAANHTHTPASIGAAPSTHTHDYAAPTHSHAQSDVTGLSAALDGKAAASHTHQQSEVSGLTDALAAKANASDMTGKADLVDGRVPASQLPSFVDDVIEKSAKSAFPATGESGKIYVAQDNNKAYRWSGTTYVEISQGVTLGETSATAYRGDRGKAAYDHSQNAAIHVTTAQKTAWDSKAAGDHTHTGFATESHTHAQGDITGLTTALAGKAASNHGHSYNDLRDKPTIPTVPSSLPANGGNADTVDGKHASAFAASGHTHTAAAVGAAAVSHTHPLADILGLIGLLPTKENGDVSQSLSGKDVLATIKAAAIGMKTYYAPANTTNSPRASHSWRFITHKTGPLYGWVLAFSNYGSVVSNYLDNGTWRGWHTIYDADPEPLWTGAAYMQHNTGSDPQIVTPKKSLSNCQHGWLLLWSDYDPGQGVNTNSDFVTTIIPKRAYSGQKWAGGAFYCDIPAYSGSNENDPTTEKRIIKILKIYDTKIEGHSLNKKGGRDDVVLRAVYEI